MNESENIGSFFMDFKGMVKDYTETRLELFRLKGVRLISKIIGTFFWFIISLFLLFLIFIFAGLVLGFWLSDITHSFVTGFGITTLMLVLAVTLLALFRKQLFINPFIRLIVRQSGDDIHTEEEE
ncbi:MAG: hypothetical protein JSU05_01575 [Bacteroidetes bacterium]|nr:hypothetical protein [Bacteroidota bacterium]